MREIKFQFIYQGQPYSETNQERPIVKKVYSLSEVCSKGLESICDVHGFMDLIAKRQYTGLKDKNGVEIYEGDAVKSAGTTDYNFGVRKVVFSRGKFTVVGYGLYDGLVEMIGNIYENPELLEGK